MTEHKPTTKSEHMVDWVECSCGWRSDDYFDGREFALLEHSKHVEQKSAMKSINSEAKRLGLE